VNLQDAMCNNKDELSLLLIKTPQQITSRKVQITLTSLHALHITRNSRFCE